MQGDLYFVRLKEYRGITSFSSLNDIPWSYITTSSQQAGFATTENKGPEKEAMWGSEFNKINRKVSVETKKANISHYRWAGFPRQLVSGGSKHLNAHKSPRDFRGPLEALSDFVLLHELELKHVRLSLTMQHNSVFHYNPAHLKKMMVSLNTCLQSRRH